MQKTPVSSLDTEQGLQPASPVGTWELTPFSSQTTWVEEGHMGNLPGSGHWEWVVSYKVCTIGLFVILTKFFFIQVFLIEEAPVH